MTQTAVVILNYNGEKFLRQFLPSVVSCSGNASIFIVDNGSTDQSIATVQKEFPQVKVIALQENFGFCGGYNRGLKKIKAKYYVLLNSDVEVTPGWLEPLVDMLEKDMRVAALQPKVLSYHQRNIFEYAGAGGGYIDSLGYPFCRGRIFKHVEVDAGQYDDTREIFWATGACMIIRSSVYEQFDGLDEYLFAHMEEIDLCWKIHRTNSKVMYCGKSTVYHVGAGTLGYDNPHKTFLNFRNGLILIYKHLDSGELWYKLPLRMMLDWLAAFLFLLQGKSANAWSVLRAHHAFIKDIGIHRKKRKLIHKDYPRYTASNIYKGSIVLDYYVQGKKNIEVNNL
jgi:hypothetical protein